MGAPLIVALLYIKKYVSWTAYRSARIYGEEL